MRSFDEYKNIHDFLCEKSKYMDIYLPTIFVQMYLYLRSEGIIKEWKKYSEKE